MSIAYQYLRFSLVKYVYYSSCFFLFMNSLIEFSLPLIDKWSQSYEKLLFHTKYLSSKNINLKLFENQFKLNIRILLD